MKQKGESGHERRGFERGGRGVGFGFFWGGGGFFPFVVHMKVFLKGILGGKGGVEMAGVWVG